MMTPGYLHFLETQRLTCDVRNESDLAGALDGMGQAVLMPAAGASLAGLADPLAVVHELLEHPHVLVVNHARGGFDAKDANLLLAAAQSATLTTVTTTIISHEDNIPSPEHAHTYSRL